ncbi:P-loop ATPase, Sll1717 family [Methylobacterium fujisawaense]
MKNILEVESFGAAEADTDDLLLDCFQDHEAYVAAKLHKKFLIVGRKGSGKTAIFRKLYSEKAYNQFCHGHSFSDYPWFHHDKQKKTGVPDNECYRYSWEYVILISLAKLVINDASEPWTEESLEAMARLESFLVDTYGTKNPELNRIFSPETCLKLKPSLTAGWGPVKASVSAEKVEVLNLPTIIYEVNEALLDTVIRCINPHHSYHICFDELDRGFIAGDDNYRFRLSGLLIAARDFNKRFRTAKVKASVVVFLRDDILRYLKFEDRNKIIEDSAALIEWDKESATQTLKNIMAKRFSKVLGVREEDAWDTVFDEEAQMPGRQTKYQYMLDRTFKRPRDIIKFGNEVLKSYKRDSHREAKFRNQNIANARIEYSKYLRKELVDEVHQHMPHEAAVFDLLRAIGTTSFSIDRFKEDHAAAKGRDIELPSYSATLRMLYSFSIIGYLKVGGMGGGSEWVYQYEDTDAEYDERATIFRVHNGLKEALSLKQGRAYGSMEGVDELTQEADIV